MYDHAKQILDATSDKMEDGVNEQPQASPRKVEEGSRADFNHTTYLPREVADKRSIFVGNLDYDDPTEAEIKIKIKEFFGSCGTIKRVTIRTQRLRGGRHAYVEFTTQEAVAEALKLDKEYREDMKLGEKCLNGKPATVRV